MLDSKNPTHRQLFLLESNGDFVTANLVTKPSVKIDRTAWNTWSSTKREFTFLEVVEQQWVRSSDNGQFSKLHFLTTNIVVETGIQNPYTYYGIWKISNGMLCVNSTKERDKYCYQIVASSDGDIHSSIEYKNDEIHAYIKLIQINHLKTCH